MNRGGKMNTVIELENLHKSYNSNHVEVEVLKGIDLTINEGEFVSIMGPSGCGKSTLLYLMGGLEKPSDGNVYIDSDIINKLKDKKESQIRQEKIGFVFQFYNLVPHLTVEENILLPVVLNGKNKKHYLDQLNKLLKKIGLNHKRDFYPRELSGGQQQRVAIARALINSPKIILADEPIGNLDSKTGKDIMELFKDINKSYGTVIVQVTHSLESAKYGTRLINMVDGQIVS